jgi:hypothetical protein
MRLSSFCPEADARRIQSLLLLVALIGSSGLVVQAQEKGNIQTIPVAQSNAQSTGDIEAVPNRPTFSNTGETVQNGVFEVEYGLELADGHQNINGLLKFGLLKNLEVRFANIPITRDDQVASFGDSAAGFKFKFVEEKRKLPTLAFLYALIIPTATGDSGIHGAGHSAGLLVSKDFGGNHLDFNESIQWLPRPAEDGFDHNYFTAIAYSRVLKGKLGFDEEVAGFSRTNVTTGAILTILQSLTYSVSPRFVFDAGFYIAAMGDLPRATFFAGITYSVGDLYHRHRTAE